MAGENARVPNYWRFEMNVQRYAKAVGVLFLISMVLVVLERRMSLPR
jgi:hypothetical protein